jgi:hypothetical protein
MQTRSKILRPKFNGYASGTLLFTGSHDKPISFVTDEILFLMCNDFHNTHIYTAPEKSREIQINFMLAHHFWQRSRSTGESFDLRGICALPQNDPLFKDYKKPDLDIETKRALAKRAIRMNPFEIY